MIITHFAILVAVYAMVLGVMEMAVYQRVDMQRLWETAAQTHLTLNLLSAILSTAVLVLAAAVYFFTRESPVYLVDFHCYKPPDR